VSTQASLDHCRRIAADMEARLGPSLRACALMATSTESPVPPGVNTVSE
jgi:hypothetical protein